MTTYGYTRLSADHAEAAATLDTQRQVIERLAASNSLTVDEWIDEGAGASAYKGGQPELLALFDRLRPGDVLLLWELSRATRRTATLTRLMILVDGGVRVITPQLDTSDRAGMVLLSVLGSLAQAESADRSERVKAGKDRARARGQWAGKFAPFGLRLTPSRALEPDPADGKVARQILEEFLGGATGLELAERLRAVDDSHRMWHGPSVSRWVTNPALAGLSSTGERVPQWKPLITTVEHRRLLDEAARRRTMTNVGQKRAKRLLSGIAVCGSCGVTMSADRGYYRCGSAARRLKCEAPAIIDLEALDDVVLTRTMTVAASLEPDDPTAYAVASILGTVDTAPDLRREALGEKAAQLRTRMETLSNLLNTGTLSPEQYAEAVAVPAADERAVLAELAALPTGMSVDLSFLDPAEGFTLTTEKARDLIRLLFTVTVRHTGKVAFTPERVSIRRHRVKM